MTKIYIPIKEIYEQINLKLTSTETISVVKIQSQKGCSQIEQHASSFDFLKMAS